VGESVHSSNSGHAASISRACGFYPPDPVRVRQRFVILLGSPRVTDGTLGERVIKGVALAAITCNHRRIPGLGVRQRPAAHAAVIWKQFGMFDRGATFHVRKLADVKLYSFNLTPTQEDIRRSLDEPLADDHPLYLTDRQLSVASLWLWATVSAPSRRSKKPSI
jgi:hypothetical protein